MTQEDIIRMAREAGLWPVDDRITAIKEALAQPAQRPWAGLTEVDVLAESKHWRNPEDFLDGVYWAETTLKEKNT